MIARLEGVLAEKSAEVVVLDVHGVGYEVRVPLSTFFELPDEGKTVRLRIHTHVREDSLQLFGFHDVGEKQVFLLLTSVSGIGPKLALNILSGIPAEELARALKGGDQVRLVAIPGVGKKLAERMIVELKDKFATLEPWTAELPKSAAGSQLILDAVSALVNLGYKKPDAEKYVSEALKTGNHTLESVLKETLRRMSF